MYLYSVIPLTKIPRPQVQMPLYFSTRQLEAGCFVEVPLGRRRVAAFIYQSFPAQEHRQQLRAASYALKNISRVLVVRPVLHPAFLNLVRELADHYYEPVGLMLRRLLPPFFAKPTRPLLAMLETLGVLFEPAPAQRQKASAVFGPKRFTQLQRLLKTPALVLAAEHSQASRLSEDLLTTHSAVATPSLSVTKWRELWEHAHSGKLDVLIGARTALITPFASLNTVLLEDEPNDAHKSWDLHPKFDVRLVAERFAEHMGATFVAGGLLPSVAAFSRFKPTLPSIPGPKPVIVDMREELAVGNRLMLSRPLYHLLENAKPDQKVLLLINRRGFSSALLCRDCGKVVNCPQCESAFVVHQRTMVCHRCGTKRPVPRVCPACDSARIKPLGGGTQRVAEEVADCAPNLVVARLDSDIAPTREEQEHILADFREGDTNVLVATALALKEHALPTLDTSAIIMLDTVLTLPAYRSGERVFSMVAFLRLFTKSNLFVQTYHPQLPLFALAQASDATPFYEKELAKRKALRWPPFVQLVKLTYSHRDAEYAEREAVALKRKLEAQTARLARSSKLETQSFSVLGPAPGFIPRVAGKNIWYILVKWPLNKDGSVRNLQLRNHLLSVVPPGWDVDVDPLDVV
ncbi:MAG: primosomal protein N' [Candidatus Spechtbacterales bacterium]